MKTEFRSVGWKLVKFGDVVRNVNENSRDFEADGIERVVGLDHLDSDSLPLRRWDDLADLPDGTSFSRKFRAGQVLFGKRRAYQRKVAVADFDGICSGDILVFESASEELLPEFLPYVVQSKGFFEQALGTSAGSLSPRTKWSDLAKYEFALPPIDEQRRLAENFELFDRVTCAYEEVTRRAEQLISSTVEHFLRVWSHVVPTVRVEDVSLSGPRNGLAMRSGGEAGDYVTVALSAVRNGTLELEGNLKATSFSTEVVRPYLLHGGEFLVVRGNGNRQLVGRACLVGELVPGLFHHDKLIRLFFDPSRIDNEFALLQWNSDSAFSRLNARAKGSNGIFMVNGADLRAHELLLPSLKEQRELVERIDSFHRVAQASREGEKHSRIARAQYLNRGDVVQHVQ